MTNNNSYRSIIFVIILFFISFVFIVSCSNDNHSEPPSTPNTENLTFLDITNAKNLFIASVNNTKSTNNKLFKITNSGYVEEVKYYNEERNEISLMYQPIAIYNVNSEYVIVCFGIDKYSIASGYLVRKSDGAVFSLENAGFPIEPQNYFKNAKIIHTDQEGNIYYLRFTSNLREIVKLNTKNPASITAEVYSPFTDSIEAFVVDPRGNILYGGFLGEIGVSPDYTKKVFRIKMANGAIYNLSIPGGENIFWRGPDGNFYYIIEDYEIIDYTYYYFKRIKKITITQNYEINESIYGDPFDFLPNRIGFILNFNNSIINVVENSIFEIYNSSNQPREVILPGLRFQSIYLAVSSPNYYYIAGKNEDYQPVLVKVNPLNDSYSFLINPGEYEVYKMTVSNDDELTFSALRRFDGAKIIGKVDSTGKLTIIDESLNTEIVILERIN